MAASTAPLAVHDTGTGPALLFLHAYPLDSSQWDAQVAAIGDRRCLRPDFWGCGVSPPPPSTDVSVDDYAQAVLAMLDDRGVGDVDVCGSSMGGYTAFALLRAAPSRVRSLVLTGSRATADDDVTRQSRVQAAAALRADGVEAIVEPNVQRLLCAACRDEAHIADPLRGRARRWSAAGALAMLGALASRPDSTPLLTEIAMPTLVVVGDADAVVPIDEVRALAAAIPGARLEVMEGHGHLCNLEQPHRFTRLLQEFLGG